MPKIDIHNLIITPDTAIPAALEAINKNGVRGIFVCDEGDELLGIVMDSDIRRALLAKLDLESSVKTIMRTSPFVISATVSTEQRPQLLVQSDKLLVPIVDTDNRVVDYIYLPDILDQLCTLSSTAEPMDDRILSPQRVLVIGGMGYIGSVLVSKLVRMGYRVRVLDLLLYGKVELSGVDSGQFEFVRGDCRDEQVVKEVLKDVDAVVHLVEIVGDPACAINEAFAIETNYAATQMIIEECMKSRVKRFVFASSCSVYGHNDAIVDEQSACNPVSLYARCKIESEKAILSNGYDLFCPTILRLATVHGQSFRQRFDLVVNLLTIRAVAEGRITIFGGQQWRPFISVPDICQGILTVLRSEAHLVKNQIFNLGDSRENYQLIDIGKALKTELPDIEMEVQTENVDKRNYRVSFEKVKNTLGFTAEYSIADTVYDLVSAYRDKHLYHDHKDARYHNYLSLK